MNGVRAFVALLATGLIWIEMAWDGVRAGMILVAILCSLVSTFPRPLLACQSMLRGVLLACLVSAVLLFGVLPTVGDFEMLALCLLPVLYVVAIGLGNPQTAGIAIGLGLNTFLLVGPQNQGLWYNSATQWFEFAGGYLFATFLALLSYAWLFPFDADRRIRRLFRQTRSDVRQVLLSPASEAGRFTFESRMVDRLANQLGLLPAARAEDSARRFECSLACMTLGVVLHQLHTECADHEGLPADFRARLATLLGELAAALAQPPRGEIAPLLPRLYALSESLDALHAERNRDDLGLLRPVFASAVALLIGAALLERYQDLLGESPSTRDVLEDSVHAH